MIPVIVSLSILVTFHQWLKFSSWNLCQYLFVCDNDRIHLFHLGQSNGITISDTFILDCPIAIVVDSDQYLFIVDRVNHRIVFDV